MIDNTPFDARQEAEYVLGLTDMYRHDFEIENALRRKGLTDMEIVEVMDIVRTKFNQKRMRQGRKIMWIGIGIAVSTGAVWAYMMGLFDGKFDVENLVYSLFADVERPESFITTYLGYGFIAGMAQAIIGASRYIVYFRKSNS